MTAAKATPEQDRVTCEIEIAASPERVFRALTDQKELFTWWGKEPSVTLSVFEMEGRKGGRWQFRCRPVKPGSHGAVEEQLRRNRGGQEYVAHGEVLECEPPRLLVWSWIANWHEHPEQATTVRWELTPTAKGTRVRVTHSGLAQEAIARKDYGRGWQGVLQLLKNFF
ncbi:MAG TPA: SRPBCC domain-containing protein [Methylomirabilota bacterium]|nr:SRPBCC domain-containing protein [Methylomirabilota bacterium]